MKEFEVGDKVKITDCNTNKMVGVEGTIVYVSAKDDLFNYLLRISTDDYKDVGWRIAEGYGCADIPYGLVADYEDDDRYTFWWVAPSEIESVEDEGEEMKSFELGETVRHKPTNCTGKIVYIEKNDAVPYLVRFDADSPYGWGMIENRDNVMHLPQSLIDDYIDEEDYKFWWSPAAFLEHVVTADKEEDEGEEKEVEEFHTNDRVYHTNFSSKGTIVYIDEGGTAPYLVRFDADVPDGWLMSNNKANFMQLPQKLYDTYKSNNDYCFWWATAAFLTHVKDEETTVDNEKMQHDIQKQLDEIVDKVDSEVGACEDTKYHDTHYKSCAIEPIEAMQVLLSKEQFKGFLLGNVLKYRLRAGHKDNALSDIDKAVRYEQWLTEFEEKGVITL